MKKTVQQAFGERVRQLRKARGWSQEELGEHAGKHWTYVGGIERGERNPTLLVIADLAKAFGVPMRELFSDSRSADLLVEALKEPSKTGKKGKARRAD